MQSSRATAELKKIQAETEKARAEIEKLKLEARKLSREIFWYPVAIASGLIGSVIALTTIVIKSISSIS